MAVFSIIGFRSFLLGSESNFESFKKILSKSFGKITAEAVTGPAKQPLPASSVPHSKSNFEKLGKRLNCVKV